MVSNKGGTWYVLPLNFYEDWHLGVNLINMVICLGLGYSVTSLKVQ